MSAAIVAETLRELNYGVIEAADASRRRWRPWRSRMSASTCC